MQAVVFGRKLSFHPPRIHILFQSRRPHRMGFDSWTTVAGDHGKAHLWHGLPSRSLNETPLEGHHLPAVLDYFYMAGSSVRITKHIPMCRVSPPSGHSIRPAIGIKLTDY